MSSQNMVERMVTLETKEWMCSVGAGEIGVCLGDVEGRVWMYGVTEGGKGGPGGDLKECLQPKLVFKVCLFFICFIAASYKPLVFG